MNTYAIIICSAIVLVFLYFLGRFIDRARTDDRVKIPRHVPLGESNSYSGQDVFDWVVYATKVGGEQYLHQMAWDECTVIHDELLCDLRRAMYLHTEEERLQWFHHVGKAYKLDTSIVDAAH